MFWCFRQEPRELVATAGPTRSGPLLVTNVEEVREHDFIVSLPVTDGSVRQIA